MTTDANQAEHTAVPPAPETRQFDFWLGEWDVSWDGGRGTNSIRSILGGHVVEERFHAESPPFEGMSVSVYNARRGLWQQTWVDDQGTYLDLSGGWRDGEMTLSTERLVDGKPATLRMVFYNIAADQLDWRWERSTDGSEWQILWQIRYQRRG